MEGLGRCNVEAFTSERSRIVVNYRESAQAVQEHFKKAPTSVVNNALVDLSFNGNSRPGPEDIDWDSFNTQFTGSIRGARNALQAALTCMREQSFGRVVKIGTNLFQDPVVPYHDYIAAKALLLALKHTLVAALGRDHISVNMASGGL